MTEGKIAQHGHAPRIATAETGASPARRRAPLVVVLVAAALALGACGGGDRPLPGEREPVRPDLTGAAAAARATGTARPISLPASIVNADWSQQNGTAQGVRPHAALADLPQLRWSRDIGEGSKRRTRLLVNPVVADGLVFTVDAAGLLSATTAQGELAWSASLVPEGQRPGTGPGGGLAVSNGVLFAATGFGEVRAIRPASGQVLWRQSFGAPVRAAPVVEGGRVFVVLGDDTALALSAATGEQAWSAESSGGTGLLGGATPAVSGSIAVIPFASGELRGVSAATGTWQWGTAVTASRFDLARSTIGDITGDPVISGSSVYASSQNGRTIRLDRNSGERLWTLAEGA